MSTQIAVRLPDEMVAFLDRTVATGRAPSRAAVVAAVVEREMRRQAAEQDADVLRSQGLDNVVTVPVELLGRTLGHLSADQESQLARAVVLAYDLDVPLLG